MTKSMNLRKELFPGEHKLDEKICLVGEKRLQRRRLAQKLYPLNEEEFQLQYQSARSKIAQYADL